MDNFDILERFFETNREKEKTEAMLVEAISNSDISSTTHQRCIYSMFVSYTMYKNGLLSEKELLIKLRDFVLFEKRIKANDELLQIVKRNGLLYDLYVEDEGYINATLNMPSWFKDDAFVRNTYRLLEEQDRDKYTLGDSFLEKMTLKYDSYKSFELKAAVHTALTLPGGYSMIVSLPTGAGKSLITQMVSYHSNGLTIVIVPTVALAIDQNLAAHSIFVDSYKDSVFYYSGQQTELEYKKIIDGIKTRKAKLLFISPEALLKNVRLNELLDTCAEEKYLKNIVIDEAHIVSDWGVLFRPDFQVLSFAMRRWKEQSEGSLRTYLLSATLPDDTIDNLKRLFVFDENIIEYRCDALRREPQFCFYESKSTATRLERLKELIIKLPKPMIIYFMAPEEVIEFHRVLIAEGFKNIKAFHGNTKDADRKTIMDAWKKDSVDIILGTSAFGIGVDKSNVRTIIHACVPENLSRFYQEIGRAGRDGKACLSVLMPYTGQEYSDSDKAYNHVKGLVLRVETMVSRWFGMIQHAFTTDDIIEMDTSAVPGYFTEEAAQYAGELNSTWNINLLLFLHRNKYIEIQDAFYQLDSKSYHFRLKVLRINEMTSEESFAKSLCIPREKELEFQLTGYKKMRDLILHPRKKCWGTRFQELYPLSVECCNGCPVHPENTYEMDDEFRIRQNIDLQRLPADLNGFMRGLMRDYKQLIVRNAVFPMINIGDLEKAVIRVNKEGIRTLVGEVSVLQKIPFAGLKLTEKEFFELVKICPGLFNAGVFVIFGNNAHQNDVLFKNVRKLGDLGYRAILYCSDSMYILSMGKRITDFLDCQIKNIGDFGEEGDNVS